MNSQRNTQRRIRLQHRLTDRQNLQQRHRQKYQQMLPMIFHPKLRPVRPPMAQQVVMIRRRVRVCFQALSLVTLRAQKLNQTSHPLSRAFFLPHCPVTIQHHSSRMYRLEFHRLIQVRFQALRLVKVRPLWNLGSLPRFLRRCQVLIRRSRNRVPHLLFRRRARACLRALCLVTIRQLWSRAFRPLFRHRIQV